MAPREHGMKRQRGYSLAELIIVLAILAILVALTLSRMTIHRVRAMNEACNGIMSMLKRAADAYYADSGGKVPTVDDLVDTGFLVGHPADPHDTHRPYQLLLWEGDQVKVVCPLYDPSDPHAVTFPPGHQ